MRGFGRVCLLCAGVGLLVILAFLPPFATVGRRSLLCRCLGALAIVAVLPFPPDFGRFSPIFRHFPRLPCLSCPAFFALFAKISRLFRALPAVVSFAFSFSCLRAHLLPFAPRLYSLCSRLSRCSDAVRGGQGGRGCIASKAKSMVSL